MLKKVLVVLSGGQDSTTCLFLARELADEVHAVTFDYGQRHRREIQAACKVAEMAGVVTHEVIRVPNCLKSTSPLTDDKTDLEKYKNFEQMDSVIGERTELTFVPMRNSLFFIIAANRAVALSCNMIVTGICQEDNANYPDCREPFRRNMEILINSSLGFSDRWAKDKWINLHAPLMYLSKADSVKLAYRTAGAWGALAHTHTSYDGKYPPTDMNHANVLRAHGFQEANLPDPLVLRAWEEGLMPLPTTPNYDVVRQQGKGLNGSR